MCKSHGMVCENVKGAAGNGADSEERIQFVSAPVSVRIGESQGKG